MKFKLDENLGSRLVSLFSEAGHDVMTVAQQKLSGADDATIFTVCAREKRCLVTLDLDFANVLRFPPQESAGIAVLRPPKHASIKSLETITGTLIEMLRVEAIAGRLWIVEPSRVRVHDSSSD